MARDRGVEQRDGEPVDVDPLRALGGVGLVAVGVVVAAHVVEPVAERGAVGREEGGVLLVEAVAGEVALHEDGVGVDRGHLRDGAAVHQLGVGLGALLDAEERAVGDAVHDPADGLAEVHVVDRGDGGEPLAEARERAELEALELVVGVGSRSR